jgi:hypothetical protein
VAEDGSREWTPGAPGMTSGILAKRPIYSCRAHIATSFVLATIVTGREVFRGYLEILGGRGIRLRTSEIQVSSMIILHRIRVSIFGQGLYGGPYKGFYACGPPCVREIQKYALTSARLPTR